MRPFLFRDRSQNLYPLRSPHPRRGRSPSLPRYHEEYHSMSSRGKREGNAAGVVAKEGKNKSLLEASRGHVFFSSPLLGSGSISKRAPSFFDALAPPAAHPKPPISLPSLHKHKGITCCQPAASCEMELVRGWEGEERGKGELLFLSPLFRSRSHRTRFDQFYFSFHLRPPARAPPPPITAAIAH